jgi:Na+/H+ antiporter NhaD/arsenite permease-like protein
VIHFNPSTLSDGRVLAAYIIFFASYLVFAIGKFPGLKVDRTGAAIIGAVAMVAFRIVPGRDILKSIDFSTVVLLFSMMLIVGNLHLVGFFEWNAEFILRRLDPKWLLPAVIFTCGILSAFFVNDIVCLVMVPFVLTITRRLRLEPVPYLLAVATASNIGSVATITGNPQNMLVGSYSHIPYRTFLWHLGPVAIVGLFIDWAILHWMHFRTKASVVPATQEIPLPALDLSRLTKPAIVVTAVMIGFFVGVPPAMMAALGAAALLITRTLEPKKLYREVDWGLLVFFVGLFIIVGGAENAGVGNIVSNVPAVMLLKSLVPDFVDPHTAWLMLAMASTLSGNLTITGSVANIIVVESAKPDASISFADYLKVGVPITFATLLVGGLWVAWIR